MKQAIKMLDEVKESIMNAYEIKTGLTRQTISHLMDGETWMNVHKAIELGFCDGVLERENGEEMEAPKVANLYSKVGVENSLKDKLVEKCQINTKKKGIKSQDLIDRLNLMKNWR